VRNKELTMDQLQFFQQIKQEFAEMDDVNSDLQILAQEQTEVLAEDLLAELDAEWLAASLLNCR